MLALYYQAVADSGAAVAAVESLKKAIEDAPEHAGAIHALAWHQVHTHTLTHTHVLASHFLHTSPLSSLTLRIDTPQAICL